MPDLKSTPTLADFQIYVDALESERGFQDQALIQKCLLLGEEIGELFKAVRQREAMLLDPASRVEPLADELADVLIYLCAIANRCGVDLEQAFRAKEEKNKKRVWR